MRVKAINKKSKVPMISLKNNWAKFKEILNKFKIDKRDIFAPHEHRTAEIAELIFSSLILLKMCQSDEEENGPIVNGDNDGKS